MERPKLTDEAKKVLGSLSKEAMDGFMLQSQTRLDRTALSKALKELAGQSLIQHSGDILEESVEEAYLFVPPAAQGEVDRLLKE